MNKTVKISALAALALTFGGPAGLQAQQAAMTFFVTSAGPGKGGDLGGLAGADAHCQSLAQAASAGNKTWRVLLSSIVLCRAQPVHSRVPTPYRSTQKAHGAILPSIVAHLLNL